MMDANLCYRLNEELCAMSQKELEAVIGRAILDQEFRMDLFASPATALTGYDLTAAEVAALRWVDAESLDACAGIGRRIHLSRLRIRAMEGEQP
jgi:hypothetical protein